MSNNYKTFFPGCHDLENLPIQSRKTVESLLKRLKTFDLERAAKKVTTLTSLDLSSSEISDLNPLSGLSNLTYLCLRNNYISDLTPLSKLTNLTHLDLSGNRITDVSPLAKLKNLNKLYLNSNWIADLSPLSALTNLTDLDLNHNRAQVYNLNSLSRLTNLTHLDIEHLSNYSKILDVGFLSQLTNLKELWLGNNPIPDLSPLADLVNLSSLSLSSIYCAEHNFKYLSGLKDLTWLSVENNNIQNLNFLSDLSDLVELELSGNKITDLRGLAKLTKLTDLELNDNQISDLSPIADLKSLNNLELRQNQISDLTPLGGLANLTDLWLNDNQITDLKRLKNLTNITWLSLDNNPIKDLSALGNLPNLNELIWNGISLARKYWEKPFSQWRAEWILEENNSEIRRLLIATVGYQKILQELKSLELDRWREYTLLKIEQDLNVEDICLLKMNCPSTSHIHVLRVPPDITSAKEAITWVNWGIDPEKFVIET